MTLQASPSAACSICSQVFVRRNSMHRACSPRCALKLVKATKKKEAQDTRARRVALKSRADWLNEAQVAVNKYVRLAQRGTPCVSCGADWSDTAQAGHFLSRGSHPELRFDLDNIHSQCVRCNMHLHGNILNYRQGLISRIGLERVEALEGPHPPAKWTVEDLIAIRDEYRAKAKQLLEQQ